MSGTAEIVHGNALDLPIPDATVDLIVTSPPYFGLRSYQDGGEHYEGQIGAEATPAEFVDALIAATREMVRVLNPSGSIFVNLGDKYSTYESRPGKASAHEWAEKSQQAQRYVRNAPAAYGVPYKSLMGIPWRYALRCIDDLGLILRAEIVWAKPNGLPESVTDRVRRSHETWFHFTKQPRYFSAVDEVRERHAPATAADSRRWDDRGLVSMVPGGTAYARQGQDQERRQVPLNPLGKLPGSVWEIPTQPLRVPAHLGIDHFAAFPMEWPRRIIRGWSPSGVCVECGEGRRPVTDGAGWARGKSDPVKDTPSRYRSPLGAQNGNKEGRLVSLTGYACACPTPTAPTTPAVVLDPFGGTGTTALVAKALGRRGVSVDLSRDYCRLAEWRTNDPGELARAMQVEKPPAVDDQQGDLLEMLT